MTTYGQLSAPQLLSLCKAVGLAQTASQCLAAQSLLLGSLADHEVPSLAPFPSRIGDDHSPYEYSVQFSRQTAEVRLLLEAQAAAPSLEANQAAAQALNELIATKYGVDLSPFKKVEDLFCPADPQVPFSLWHAACFDRAGLPDFKIYLNPRVHRGITAEALVGEAASRLGLSKQMTPILESVVARGGVPNYFSLDLASRLGMRTKLYFAHHDASPLELESIFSLCPGHLGGDVLEFCQAILGHTQRLTKKAVCYCFSFTQASAQPISVTLHLPAAHYLENDALVVRRVSDWMTKHGLPAPLYQRAVASMARRSLDERPGLQSYTSFRRERGALKLTVYLSPELFQGRSSQFPPPRSGANAHVG